MSNKLEMINILGFGIMGRQIASLFQLVGYEVNVWSRSINEDSTQLYLKELKKIEKFLIPHPQKKDGIQHTEDIKTLTPALTFEVLIEDIDVKKKVIASLDYDVTEYGILTNTSSYSPLEIHHCAVGLHFFNPIYLLKFAELSHSALELSSAMKLLVDRLCSELGFEIIAVNNNRGYIGNYLLFQEIANALKLIDKFGYDTNMIDKVLSHMGRSISIFDIIDLVGVDVTRSIILNLKETDPSISYSSILDKALAENVLGKKNRTSIRNIIDSEKLKKGVI